MKLIAEGKINLNIEVSDLLQAKSVLESTGLTPLELWSLSIAINSCTYYYNDTTKQLVPGAQWDKTDEYVRAQEKELWEHISATMTPWEIANTNLSRRPTSRDDWDW